MPAMTDHGILGSKVGKSGKPRPCYDCARRKVKCDYRQPICSRCEKANIACQGYKHDTTFVNRTPENLAKSLKRKVLEVQVPRSLDEDLQELKELLRVQPTQQTLFRLRALDFLKKLYLPQPHVANIRESSLYSWLPTVCDLEGESQSLDHSLLTFCVVQAAVTRMGNTSVEEALQVYNDTLQKLLMEIKGYGESRFDEILAAISVLSTSELFLCPTDHAWRAHAQGVAEILRTKRIINSPSPLCMSFCTRVRVLLVMEALTKPSSRSMTIQYCRQITEVMSTNTRHDSFHELIDVACEAPAVLEQSDLLMSESSTLPDQEMRIIFSASLNLIEKLEDRQQRYRAEVGKPLFWTMPSSVENPADASHDSKVFPFALHFINLETGSQVILLWSITLQVLCSMLDLYEHFFDTSASTSACGRSDPADATASVPILNLRFPTMLSVKAEADKLARYLCQTIEYCHKIANGTIGCQMTCFSRWILKSYFRRFNYKRELAWCLNIKNMKGPEFRHGIELMGFQE